MITSTQTSPDALNDLDSITRKLLEWLVNYLTITKHEAGLVWLNQTLDRLSENASERVLFTQFSAAPRKVGKADLVLTESDIEVAQALRSGWMPEQWSVDQATRALLLLTFPSDDADFYVETIEKLVAAADVAEQVAFYQTLPLLPYPNRFKGRAIDGLRTNMTSVFNAIALNNPYPADYFDEAAWNQMVLKALFVESRLSQIQGLESRANAKLAQMLSDYAHERWAAGRAVNPQLWRSLGPFAEGDLVADLERAMSSSEIFEQEAAALACAMAPSAEATALLDHVPAIKQRILSGQLTWEQYSQSHP